MHIGQLFIQLIILCFIHISHSLVVNSYSGYMQGYAITPSYDTRDFIYLLGGDGPDSGYVNKVYKYSILTQEFTAALSFSRIQVASSFGGDGKEAGDFYVLSTTSGIYKFSATTGKIFLFAKAPIKPGTALFAKRGNLYFLYSMNGSDGENGGVELFRYQEGLRQSEKIADIPPGADTHRILSSDGNRTLYIIGGKNTSNFQINLSANSGREEFEVMRLKLPVDDIVSNVISVGNFRMFFSNHFAMVTVHLKRQIAIVEELDFQNVEKVFHRFNAVYVEKKKKIYVFVSGGRIRGSSVLTIDICRTSPPLESDQIVLERSAITLQCPIADSLKPFIQWRYNGKIKSSAKIDENSKLVLKSIRFGHGGNYTCHMEGICGFYTHQIYLQVRRRTVIDHWKTYVQARPGATVELDCNAITQNYPIAIHWYKGDTALEYTPQSRYRLKGDNGLAIFDADENDSGNYTCVVDTSLDSVQKTLTLEISNDANGGVDTTSTPRPGFFLKDTNHRSSAHLMPAIIAGVVTGIVVVGLCAILSVYWFCKYKRASAMSFTAEEIKEFRLGRASVVARGNNYSVEDFTYGQPYDASFELPLHSFEIQRELVLGHGEFGVVYKGVVKVGDKIESVAFKTTKHDADMPECRKALKGLLSELKVMIYIGHHPNIIRLIGASTQQLNQGIAYVAIEFCPYGSLEKLLQTSKHESTKSGSYESRAYKGYDTVASVTNAMQCDWSLQIAKGMEHLTSKNIIHSDLATRNILVASDLSIRISDFGLSRRLENYENYVKQGKEPLPWRWMALESLECRNFSTYSDVWSFGVTLWEIYSMGNMPYPADTWTLDFVQKLHNGERLSQPIHASDEIYNKMRKCWALEPSQRPEFKDLVQFFQEISYCQHYIVYQK